MNPSKGIKQIYKQKTLGIFLYDLDYQQIIFLYPSFQNLNKFSSAALELSQCQDC